MLMPAGVQIGERILLTLWAGALWTVGFIVAPMLFATLDDRSLAGSLAGELFRVTSYLGLVCGSLLLIGNWSRCAGHWFNWRALVLVAMLALVVIGHFVLTPMIADLRAQGLSGSPDFGRLHGLASALFMLVSVGALALVAGRSSDSRL